MRWLYRSLIRLYPRGFRRRFEDEMLLIFDESVATKQGTALLLGDVLVSLFRRWVLRRAGPGIRSHSLQPRTWWLLASCGILNAIYSGMNFFMQDPDGSLTLRTGIHSGVTLVHMGQLALAAGACTIAAGTWSFRDRKSWLLVLNGLACSALGLSFYATTVRPVGFHSFALPIVLMALSIGIYELATARTLRRHAWDRWLLVAAGVVSVGFAFAFFAFAYGWIQLEPRPLSDFIWFGSYFGFSAICMLGFAIRLHGLGPSHWIRNSQWEALPPTRNPNTHIQRAVTLN